MSDIAEIINRDLLQPTPAALEQESFRNEEPTVVNALSSVINYIISDAFMLSSEESMWVGYHLGNIFTPLNSIIPLAILGAVRQEMRTREYSNRMFNRTSAIGEVKAPVAGVKYAPIEDWVDAISEIVLSCYPSVRPMIKSAIIGSLHGLLTELGVSANPKDKNARGSQYLPTAVRYRLKNS
jgi:hypothetical protein